MQAALDRYVAARGPRNPDVQLRTVTAFNTFIGYLSDRAMTTQLALVGAHKTSSICQLVSASGGIRLSQNDFSLLVAR